MKRRSFLALLWTSALAWLLPKPKSIPSWKGLPWEQAKQYKLGPSTELRAPDIDVPVRSEYRENPEGGGFLVRTFYESRPKRSGQMVVVTMRDAEVFTSKYLTGEPIPRPSLLWRLKCFWKKPRGVRC